MDNQIMHFVLILVVGVIIADMISNAAGTKALFGGFGQMWQILTNPTNNGQGFK